MTPNASSPTPDHGPTIGTLVVRQWSGRVRAERSADYLHLMATRALPDYRRIDGNLGAFCMHRRVGDVVEITILSWWRDRAAIAAFAGPDISIAKYYDFDAGFLLEMEPLVKHFEGFGPLPASGAHAAG